MYPNSNTSKNKGIVAEILIVPSFRMSWLIKLCKGSKTEIRRVYFRDNKLEILKSDKDTNRKWKIRIVFILFNIKMIFGW